jgi:hypothetical protein
VLADPKVSAHPFWSASAVLFAGGALGVLGLAPAIGPLIERSLAGKPHPNLPLAALVALSLIQPTVLLAIAVVAGVRLAPRVGLRSHATERVTTGLPIWPALRGELPLALVLGAVGAGFCAGFDLAFRPWLGPTLETMSKAMPAASAAMTVAGLFYGGLTEELLLRWGLMTALVWCGWRLTRRGDQPPRPVVYWAALLLTALIFGALHLPATRALAPLTPLLIARALLENGLVGALAGWLYWRRSLEAAMACHAGFHVVISVATWIALAGHAAVGS